MTKRAKNYSPNDRYAKEDWDAVDSPPMTDVQAAQARPFFDAFPALAETMRKTAGGRQKAQAPKVAVSIRLDPDVVDHFRATGQGWQGRMNDALRRAAGL